VSYLSHRDAPSPLLVIGTVGGDAVAGAPKKIFVEYGDDLDCL